jgi:hypothetical protein
MQSYKTKAWLYILAALTIFWLSCKKNAGEPPGPYVLKYADSILYIKQQSKDYIVHPTERRAGTYFGFPDDIVVDTKTGAINVSKSEPGLRYRITHVSPAGDSTSALVIISGITYFDKYYNLSQDDSLAIPVYNADANRPLPLAGSEFDSDNTANSGGCSVKTTNGQINLAETVRNGVFGTTPVNDARREFDISYRLNDPSGKAKNRIKVKLYYYHTLADVAPDLLQVLQEREEQGVFLGANLVNPLSNMYARPGSVEGISAVAKPRPPCIIIIGQ